MSVEQRPAESAPPLVPLHCLRHAEPGPPRLAALPTGTPVWLVETGTPTSARCSPTPA